MTTTYTLAVGATVDFTVRIALTDAAGEKKTFPIRFLGKRQSREEIDHTSRTEPELTTAAFLHRHIHGWKEQRLVLDAAGQPAEFNTDAFNCVLGIINAEPMIYAAYLEACMASATPVGRAKN